MGGTRRRNFRNQLTVVRGVFLLLSESIIQYIFNTGAEIVLKLRLSSTLSDVKLSVYSKDTVGQCKKKLQVSILLQQ